MSDDYVPIAKLVRMALGKPDKPAPRERTKRIRENQRGGTGEVTAVMVSPAPPAERCAVCGNFSTHWAHTHGANVCDFHPFAPAPLADGREIRCEKCGGNGYLYDVAALRESEAAAIRLNDSLAERASKFEMALRAEVADGLALRAEVERLRELV